MRRTTEKRAQHSFEGTQGAVLELIVEGGAHTKHLSNGLVSEGLLSIEHSGKEFMVLNIAIAADIKSCHDSLSSSATRL